MRRDALEALRGCALILHAGDVGSESVLRELQEIAPVHAVRGNVAADPWAHSLPLQTVVTVEQVRFQIVHRMADLRLENGVGCVVTGHSHVVKQTARDGVLYLNPGSAGPRRFRLPVTLMRAEVAGERVAPELVTLALR
jgi:uncharacterized protein